MPNRNLPFCIVGVSENTLKGKSVSSCFKNILLILPTSIKSALVVLILLELDG